LPWPQVWLDGKWRYHEGEYNKLYKNDPDFLALDRQPFTRFAGQSGHNQVEIADLYHRPTKKLLCVKWWTRSSTMSHLLSQATVSAQLLWTHPGYRDELIGQIRKQWPGIPMPADPKEYVQDMKFVYVVGTDSPSRDLDSLPVFSLVNMVKHVWLIETTAFFKVEFQWARMVGRPSVQPAPVVPTPQPPSSSGAAGAAGTLSASP
jgi:uncharacterized protein (TIGR04141 family)